MSGWNKKLEGLEFNGEETCHSLEFATSQEAWEKLNEGFLCLDPTLFEKGATANSGVAIVYNVFVKIRKAWVDPDFNYGRCFNYKETKWTTLLNNYLDFTQLDLIKSQLRMKSRSYQNYNLSYVFNNSHNNGKQCLLAATFSKRFQEDVPVVTMILRSSEITKRLISRGFVSPGIPGSVCSTAGRRVFRVDPYRWDRWPLRCGATVCR